jgi:hypothetical protein
MIATHLVPCLHGMSFLWQAVQVSAALEQPPLAVKKLFSADEQSFSPVGLTNSFAAAEQYQQGRFTAGYSCTSSIEMAARGCQAHSLPTNRPNLRCFCFPLCVLGSIVWWHGV